METKQQQLDFILRKRPLEVLFALQMNNIKRYPASIGYEIHCSYSHISIILKKLEGYGIITHVVKGRIKELHLTPKGKEFINKFKEAVELL